MSAGNSQFKLHATLPIGSPARNKLRAQLIPRISHGGKKAIGKRKTARPFSPKAPTHIVLYSSRAKGLWSMNHRKNRSKTLSQVYVYAARFKVQIYRATNEGNQLHLLVKCDDRKRMADYLRVLAGRLAISITGARKHLKRVGKFWDFLCWSRLVNFGPDFFQTREFLIHLKEATAEQAEWLEEAGVLARGS